LNYVIIDLKYNHWNKIVLTRSYLQITHIIRTISFRTACLLAIPEYLLEKDI